MGGGGYVVFGPRSVGRVGGYAGRHAGHRADPHTHLPLGYLLGRVRVLRRAYFPVYLGCIAGLAGLYAVRKESLGQHGTLQPDPEKVVFGMTFVGLALGLVGNVLEYWGGTPGEDFTIGQMQGFGIELLGLLLVLFGSVMLGVIYLRARVLPSLVSWLLIAAGPGGILFSILLHAPSGTMLVFCCAWVALGYLLLTGQVTSAEQPSRVT